MATIGLAVGWLARSGVRNYRKLANHGDQVFDGVLDGVKALAVGILAWW